MGEARARQGLGEAPRPHDGPAGEAESVDLQSLIARAVQALAERTGAPRVVAWGRDHAGQPALLAARVAGSQLRGPRPGELEALLRLRRPVDLAGAEADAGLARFAAHAGFSAAAPVPAPGEEPALVLLLGDDREPPGAVRPRTLAALGATAGRLAGPAAADAAARRLRALDGEVQRMDRLAALGGLVAEIVHEIRNPLVSVKTFLQLLPERAEDPEFRGEFLAVALDELRRIERLLNVVLQNARPPAAPREGQRADLGAAFESIAQLVAFRATDRGVKLHAAGVEAPLGPRIGEDALRQVLLNLVLNAIDATPAGGTVQLRARGSGSRVVLEVADEGAGVSEAVRERLFEPFFSTKRERPGGLGLAITHRLVSEAGGSIAVHEGPAGGSVFAVTLPV